MTKKEVRVENFPQSQRPWKRERTENTQMRDLSLAIKFCWQVIDNYCRFVHPHVDKITSGRAKALSGSLRIYECRPRGRLRWDGVRSERLGDGQPETTGRRCSDKI
jgi:hypothetical protein